LHIIDFIRKWQKADLKERSAAQEHFLDLCHVFAHPTPAEADPSGEAYCFEKGASKHGGGEGFADVWKKDFFGWEYKGRHKDLGAAFNQLLLYRDALANPPLLVVCDLARIVVHTNFTGTVSATHDIPLDRLGEPRSLEILRAVFHDPEKLRPGKTSATVTQDAAGQFAGIADSMRARGIPPDQVAHFLDRVVFCQFAEDIGLLPDQIFTRILDKSGGEPVKFARFLAQLFEAMSTGGEFGLETIRHFNGSLFDDETVPELTEEEVRRIAETARLDWSAVDPSIFGTLFERGLDPAKRSQLGAHFTGRDDIETVVEAVVMQPLRREWAETEEIVTRVLATGRKTAAGRLGAAAFLPPTVSGERVSPEDGGTNAATPRALSPAALKKARAEAASLLHQFLARLQSVKVLDPACGSGNFLYVTLQKLKDLEKTAILFSMDSGLGSFLPMVGPWQLYGIEINPYAHDLAQMTVWIGWLQWIRGNGFGSPAEPILRKMTGNFQCKDAILDRASGTEPEWPRVDFIVGNPPFLGGKIMRRELGDDYMAALFKLWDGRVPREADLCCYWFEKARAHIEAGTCKRAGLLATQGIRGGANREVLKRIKKSGDIFWAVSDREWVLDGANVHVSLVAFDSGVEKTRILDGAPVGVIHPDLTSAVDITEAPVLPANLDIAFMGTTKGGAFDIDEDQALAFLHAPNPHGRPNSDVVVPWVNGLDITRRPRNMWIIDFGVGMSEEDAAKYEAVFRYAEEHVKPVRATNARETYKRFWWRHVESRPAMRKALAPLKRFLVTLSVSKHRLFTWMESPVQPDHQLFAFAREDDYFMGILQSKVHEVWALKMGTRLETRPRYTPTTCFETFPFPDLTGPDGEAKREAVAEAARELDQLRTRWLNPPEWTREDVLEFPGSVNGPWQRHLDPSTVDPATGVGLVRYPRRLPRDPSSAKLLQKRTLTALYNERPAWLQNAQRLLDEKVSEVYGTPFSVDDGFSIASLITVARGAVCGGAQRGNG
jgi:hypothetical protein